MRLIFSILHEVRLFEIWLFMNLFKFLPLRKKVVFANFNGRGFGDNPKYIANEILRQNLNWKLVWLASDNSIPFPSCIKVVKFYSIKAIFELSTAKVIINNVKNGLPYIKRQSQYYIQTWHGSFPLKYIEKESEDLLGKDYVSKSQRDSEITDLLLSSCKSDTEIYKNAFWFKGEIMEKGIPRNDIYFTAKDKDKINIKNSIGIKNNQKIVMYAPTFRDDGDIDCYNLDYNLLLRSLNSKDESWTLLIRMHPNVKDYLLPQIHKRAIMDVSKYPDPQKLVLISDLIITDYSSIIFDATLNRTPVILFSCDLDKYKKERGLRPIFFDLPFPYCDTMKKLIGVVEYFNAGLYWERVDLFMKTKVQSFDDGHASERVVERIKEVIDGTFHKSKL